MKRIDFQAIDHERQAVATGRTYIGGGVGCAGCHNPPEFDINPNSVAICKDRFGSKSLVDIVESSFESFDYPKSGVVIANSSLFFASPNYFDTTWSSIKSSIEVGGVFAGDFMGLKDSWAKSYRSPTSPLSESDVKVLFSDFEIVRFFERDEKAKTSLGRVKHWHTYSVVAMKRR